MNINPHFVSTGFVDQDVNDLCVSLITSVCKQAVNPQNVKQDDASMNEIQIA